MEAGAAGSAASAKTYRAMVNKALPLVAKH
jgi:hypothetical protein